MSATPETARPARSKLGLWSVLLAVAAYVWMFVSVSIFGAVIADQPGLGQVASGMLVIGGIWLPVICHFVGFGMGIAALFRPHDRRGLVVIGLALNGFVVLIVCVFIVGYSIR